MPNGEIDSNIERVPKSLKKFISSIEVGERKLFFLDEKYPNLPARHKIHIITDLENQDEISNLIVSNPNVRNFLCVNIQHFFVQFNKNSIIRLSRLDTEINFDKLRDERDKFITKPEIDGIEEELNDIFQIHRFGFIKGEPQDDNESYYSNLTNYFLNQLSYYKRNPNFKEDILEPFKEVLNKIDRSYYETDNENYIIVKQEGISHLNNFFYTYQLHKPFECYVHSLLDRMGVEKIHSNPFIFVNPKHSPRRGLTGYFELDGSFIIHRNNLLFIECKNSAHITQEDITNFLGKIRIIENNYGIEVRKLFFSTGTRFNVWEDIEKYGDLKLFDIKDFRKSFEELSSYIDSL